MEQYLKLISNTCKTSEKAVLQIKQLHEGGSTIPFMARYRKEATGNADEVTIAQVVEQLQYFDTLDKRKQTVMHTIEELGKMTPELRKKITDCVDATILEDIYLPYKPKKKTRATTAIEKGLQPLADLLLQQSPSIQPEEKAKAFISEQVPTIQDALQGAMDIIAEIISEDGMARDKIRNLFKQYALVHTRVIRGKEEEGNKYKDYFDITEPLAKCPSHRMLAMRRGEKEGFLVMDIYIEEADAIYKLEKQFILAPSPSTPFMKQAIADGYKRLLKPAIEVEFRLSSKQKADEEAIEVFATNTRQLLLSSPLGQKRTLAIDPGFRTGCKVVVLDELGNLLHNTTIYPHPPQQEIDATIATLQKLVTSYQIEAIAIGNGTAGRETESLCRSISFPNPVDIFMVNEAGASIYSASDAAREEFGALDLTVRGAISIGRRLMDPLSELVKIDPKSIGVGQYQHDVNQTKLKEKLDAVVESCVNAVGVDLNIASAYLLHHVSGIGPTLAKNIVSYRQTNGKFNSREALKKVPMLGPKAFEQAAGFLRIKDGEHPLDNSSVHPERYALVEKMAADVGTRVETLMKDATLRKKIDPKKYLSDEIGTYTLQDILKELEKPGRDPREPLQVFRFAEGIHKPEDLRIGQVMPGIVTNITQFGAFVDIGVKQDGLVHVSQMADRFIKDPNEVVKLNQQVMVKVVEVDLVRKRIQLSMKGN